MRYGCEVDRRGTSGLTPTSDINPAFHTAVKRAGLNLTLHDLRCVYLNRPRETRVSLQTRKGAQRASERHGSQND